MKLLKRLLAVSCSILLICSLVSCKSSSKNSSVYGKVTSIEDNVITLSLGEMETPSNGEGGNPPEMNNAESGTAPADGEKPSGNPPSRPNDESGTAQPDENGNPPEMPEGESNTAGKNDSAGGRMPGGMGGFTENGETLEITIDDESIIKVGSGDQASNGSLEDIQENSILYVEYNDDGSIKSITVQSFGRGNFNGGNKMNKPETSEE